MRENRTAWGARIESLLFIALLLAAFALRVYRLDFQSLEGDEGLSLQRSWQQLWIMWEYMPVDHVPGYFVLLWGWLRVVGSHDFGLRFLSVLPSVWAVALIFRLGDTLGNRFAGWVAAILLATSAFQVWYAQQARMYSWLMATALLSTWLCWLLLTRPAADDAGQRRKTFWIWAGYVVAITLTIYWHYYGFLIPAAHTVFAGYWWLRHRDGRAVRRWVLAGVTVFLLFVPWINHAVRLFSFSGWREPLDPATIPWMMWSAYAVGDSMPQPWHDWLSWLYLGLAVLGVVAWWRRNAEGAIFLLVTALVPFAVIMLAMLRKPDFHVRYAIFLQGPWTLQAAAGIAYPVWYWWRARVKLSVPVARGLAWGGIVATLVLGVGLVTANGAALDRQYHDTSLHKPDFRSAVEVIQKYEQPGDVILIDGPNPDLVFKHYYSGASPVYDLRPLIDDNSEEVDQKLRTMTAGAKRAWELMLFRRPHSVQIWLATQAWAAAPTYHNDIRLTLYGLADEGPMTQRPLNLLFGPELELVSVDVNRVQLRAGDVLRLSTHWMTHQQPPDYKFSLRLVDGTGTMIDNWDYVPQNWFAPTPIWIVGQPATDQHAVLIPEELAIGTYRVTLRLYDPNTGGVVQTAAGEDVTLTEIEVVE